MPRDRYGRPIEPPIKPKEPAAAPETKESTPAPVEKKPVEPNYSRKRH